MKSILGIVIGFLIAWVLLRSNVLGASGPLATSLGGILNPNEQINGSTTTYSLDGSAGILPSAPRVGGCGCS